MNSRTVPDAAPFDAVVLAGGRAARLGGADKPGLRVGGRALLDRVLAACVGAGTTVVVAAPRPTPRPVVWAREIPAGGGPLAALDAGLRRTNAELVVVLSADLPFLRERTVHRLIAAVSVADGQDEGHGHGGGYGGAQRAVGAGSADGAMLTDPEGRDQPLVAVYRAAALREALRGLAANDAADAAAGPGTPGQGEARHGLAGMPLRRLVARLEMVRITEPLAAFDCDTWDDIAAARARIREHGHVLDEWITAVKDELGIELDVDTGILLDLARDAAHGVARPAAPLTTFLVGYAAAQAGAGGGGPRAVADAAHKAAVLAARWAEEAADGTPATPKPNATTPLASGAAGPASPSGAAGSTSPSGPTSLSGAAGPASPSGAAGSTESAGSAEPAGPAGSTEPARAAGTSSPSGAAGSTESAGSAEPAGPAGSAEPAGPAGSTEPAGPTGPTGAAGPSSPSGAAGPAGSSEPSEATGSSGAAGVTGPTAAAGSAELSGTAGPSRVAKSPGVAGSAEPSKLSSPSGTAKPAESSGATGSSGAAGATGPTGAAGSAESAESSGTAGPSGPSGAAGPAGTAGPSGPSGAAGPGGTAGPSEPSAPSDTQPSTP